MKWSVVWDRIAPAKIVVYADFIDPFCYIGFHNLRRVAEPAKVPMVWKGFELNPETPTGGSLLQSAANSDLRVGMWASVENYAKKSGLLLAQPTFVPNTRLPQLWVQTVQESHVKNSLIERIYQAYLSEQKDVGNEDILYALASSLGLPREPLARLARERHPAMLEQFRQEAMKRELPGMPGFIYRGKTYFGALSENTWRAILNGHS